MIYSCEIWLPILMCFISHRVCHDSLMCDVCAKIQQKIVKIFVSWQVVCVIYNMWYMWYDGCDLNMCLTWLYRNPSRSWSVGRVCWSRWKLTFFALLWRYVSHTHTHTHTHTFSLSLYLPPSFSRSLSLSLSPSLFLWLCLSFSPSLCLSLSHTHQCTRTQVSTRTHTHTHTHTHALSPTHTRTLSHTRHTCDPVPSTYSYTKEPHVSTKEPHISANQP